MAGRVAKEEYERPGGAVFVAGDWLEIETDAGPGRGRFSGVIDAGDSKFAFLRNFKTALDPSPRRLQVDFDGDKSSMLDEAIRVDGPMQKATKQRRSLPREGQHVLYRPEITNSYMADFMNMPWSWKIGEVLWADPDFTGVHAFGRIVVRPTPPNDRYHDQTSVLLQLSDIVANGSLERCQQVQQRFEQELRPLWVAMTDSKRAFDRELERIIKENYPI